MGADASQRFPRLKGLHLAVVSRVTISSTDFKRVLSSFPTLEVLELELPHDYLADEDLLGCLLASLNLKAFQLGGLLQCAPTRYYDISPETIERLEHVGQTVFPSLRHLEIWTVHRLTILQILIRVHNTLESVTLRLGEIADLPLMQALWKPLLECRKLTELTVIAPNNVDGLHWGEAMMSLAQHCPGMQSFELRYGNPSTHCLDS